MSEKQKAQFPLGKMHIPEDNHRAVGAGDERSLWHDRYELTDEVHYVDSFCKKLKNVSCEYNRLNG